MKKIERWMLFTNASIWLNVTLAVDKLAMSVYSMSVFLLANALYTAGLALAKWLSLRGYRMGRQPADEAHPHGYGREEYRNFSRVGLVLALVGLAYMIYCLRMFWVSSSMAYIDIIAIAIAAVTFTEIGMAVYGKESSGACARSPSLKSCCCMAPAFPVSLPCPGWTGGCDEMARYPP